MLSKKTKYALHALTFLGKKQDKTPVLISDIAEHSRIPRKFLEAILLDLKKNGVLGSKMGKGGGYFLRQPAIDIRLSTVIRLFNGPIALLPCVSLNYYERCEECIDEATCGLNKVMLELRNETLKILENKSLQDIIDQDFQP